METNLLGSANSDHQSLDWNSFGALLLEQRKSIPDYMKPYVSNGPGPVPVPYNTGLPHLSQPMETHNWSYCLPRFRQAFAPSLNSIPKERLPTPNLEGQNQKRFLVFDQSGDHTTLLYNSEIGSQVPCLNTWNTRPPFRPNWVTEEPRINKENVSQMGPFINDEKDETESEMHEDTEELNALLYSDDDTDSQEDDEETSTGHSPSTMIHDLVLEKGEEEEVASSRGSRPIKKRKGYEMDNAVMDTASSLKCEAQSELEDDDAESSCGKNGQVYVSCNKRSRSRKEYIHETIRTLQTMIPDGKANAKDTIDIIDEAILYLKSLKAKAIELGLDTTL